MTLTNSSEEDAPSVAAEEEGAALDAGEEDASADVGEEASSASLGAAAASAGGEVAQEDASEEEGCVLSGAFVLSLLPAAGSLVSSRIMAGFSVLAAAASRVVISLG